MLKTPGLGTTVNEPAQRQGSVALYKLVRHRGAWLGGSGLLLVILMALFSPWLTPYDPADQDLMARMVEPFWMAGGSWLHPLGTDQLGRDYWAQILYGARISLIIGFATTVVSGVIGITLGLLSGYIGGKVDLFVNFILSVRLALPVVLVGLVAVAVLGNSLTLLIVVIGGLLWDRFAIAVRSATQRLKNMEFITSAKCIGRSGLQIFVLELLPNLVGEITVIASIELAHAILLEASLSFLGLGVQPPLTSWGLLVSEAKNQIFFRPWMIAIPGTLLVFLILSINLLGDALRDALVPDGRS